MYTRGLRAHRAGSRTCSPNRAGLREPASSSGDTLLTVVSTAAAVSQRRRSPSRLRRPVVLPSAIPLVAASRGLPRPGSKLNLEVYDPLDHELRTERLLVAAESVFTVPDSAEYSDTFRRWRVVHTDTVRAWRLDATVHGLAHLPMGGRGRDDGADRLHPRRPSGALGLRNREHQLPCPAAGTLGHQSGGTPIRH